MADNERREHERILIEMPTRMWLKEPYRGKSIEFEGYARTRDLAIGGTFLDSTYLLPIGFPVNLEMTLEAGDTLLARGEVAHTVGAQDGAPTGMGVNFTEVNAENRERLLRFFVSDRIREFYDERFVIEFPHLRQILSLKDIALIINLWEDKEGRLTALRRSEESGGAARATRDAPVIAAPRRRR